MKKKKILFLSSVTILALGGLAACGGGEEQNVEKEFKSNSEALGIDKDALQALVLGDYDALYREAAAITDPAKTDERYKAMAKAEYELIYGQGLIIPWLAQNGTAASVSKTIPWQAGRASYGLTGDKFKNVVATNSPMTKEERNKVTALYDAQKANPLPALTADADGWVSLANQYANPAFGSDGSYTVGEGADAVKFEGSRVVKELKTTYTKEPQKAFLNYLTNTWTYNSYHYCNMVDGLVENDKFGNIVGSLADKYKVEALEGGKQKWTFHIREGATWVDNKTGAKQADVVADDFVAGAEYVLNGANAAGAASLMVGFIDGAADYYAATSAEGGTGDFSKVGVKANGANEISYILSEETPYFITVLTYSPYLPVNRAFLATEGSDFGKDENHLLVNGAFRITEHVSESKMVYTKNASYYDKDHVYLDTVKRQFIAGDKTSTDIRIMYENGEIDSFTVNTKDEEGWKKYVTGPDGTGTQKNPYSPNCNAITSFGTATYIGYFNFNRENWEVTNQEFAKSYDDKLNTAKALINKNFRLGFLYGLKVEEFLKMYSPKSPIDYNMRSYTNNELVSYNGKDYTQYVDEYYKEVNKIESDDFSLTGIRNGYKAAADGNHTDPIYNAERAKAYFARAKNELICAGVPASSFPIKVDVIGDRDIQTRAFEEAMYKALTDACGEYVKININVPATDEQDTAWGSEINNYDFSMWSGWGPDYADPNTYLHTFCIDGDMVNQLGF